MSNAFIFILLGIAFIALEAILAIDGYFLWLGFAGLITALVSFFIPGLSFTATAVVFTGLSIACVGGYRIFKHFRPDIPDIDNLNSMSSRYLGNLYTIVDVQSDLSAKIQIGDALWRVRSDTPKILKVGAKVRVIDQLSSTELKVISADTPFELNPTDQNPNQIQHQFSTLLNSKNARKQPELLQLFKQVHELYLRKPDFKLERSAFYHSYLPQTIEMFSRLDAGIKLNIEEKTHLKNTIEQLSQRFKEILEVHHNNKKDSLMTQIDVLNTLSKK